MKTLEILKAGRELISDPKRWIRGHYARNERGLVLPGGYCKGAVCFCSLGALQKVIGTDERDLETRRAVAALADEMGDCIFEFNDHHSHDEVLAAWDRAIERVTVNDSTYGV